jgi:hypothetical protein
MNNPAYGMHESENRHHRPGGFFGASRVTIPPAAPRSVSDEERVVSLARALAIEDAVSADPGLTVSNTLEQFREAVSCLRESPLKDRAVDLMSAVDVAIHAQIDHGQDSAAARSAFTAIQGSLDALEQVAVQHTTNRTGNGETEYQAGTIELRIADLIRSAAAAAERYLHQELLAGVATARFLQVRSAAGEAMSAAGLSPEQANEIIRMYDGALAGNRAMTDLEQGDRQAFLSARANLEVLAKQLPSGAELADTVAAVFGSIPSGRQGLRPLRPS